VLCAPTWLTKIGKIGPFLFETNHCQKSPWWQLLILYGFFSFFGISFLIFLRKIKKTISVDWFIFLFIVLSIILITLPEFIYLKDIYPEHYRANTMFKLVFQAFMLLSLMSGYVFVRFAGFFRHAIALRKLTNIALLGLWTIVALSIIGLVALYPYLSIMSYYGNLQSYRGLDGTKYLQSLYPGDYFAIKWINEHIKGQPVLLEAQGDSYTDYERISTDTGLPTVLGWTVHEWLWRGTYDIPAPRINEVQTIYTTPDSIVARQLLNKYHVQYVYVGGLEKQKYPTLDEQKFNLLGRVVYQNSTVKIYKLN